MLTLSSTVIFSSFSVFSTETVISFSFTAVITAETVCPAYDAADAVSADSAFSDSVSVLSQEEAFSAAASTVDSTDEVPVVEADVLHPAASVPKPINIPSVNAIYLFFIFTPLNNEFRHHVPQSSD